MCQGWHEFTWLQLELVSLWNGESPDAVKHTVSLSVGAEAAPSGPLWFLVGPTAGCMALISSLHGTHHTRVKQQRCAQHSTQGVTGRWGRVCIAGAQEGPALFSPLLCAVQAVQHRALGDPEVSDGGVFLWKGFWKPHL